eukprot:g20316.t1
MRIANQSAVEARILNEYKEEMDRFLISNGLKGYGECAVMWSLGHDEISYDRSEGRAGLRDLRPLLEYCVWFGLPCYRKDIIKLERVQKMLLRMDNLSYK